MRASDRLPIPSSVTQQEKQKVVVARMRNPAGIKIDQFAELCDEYFNEARFEEKGAPRRREHLHN